MTGSMTRFCILLIAGSVLWLGISASVAQSATALAENTNSSLPRVGFDYENKQLQPAKYAFLIDSSGSGHFHSEPGDPPPKDTPGYQSLAEPLDRTVELSKPTVDQIFSTAKAAKWFTIPCEDTKDKIAFQGTKKLSYQGPEGSGACTYNWSKSNAIEKVTSTFEAIAFTLEEGRRLEVEHKHSRLALDQELGLLIDAVKGGHALELQTIQPILQEIVDDEAVLDRARSKAKKLLDSAGSTTASLR
jgi:hypothetical protein